MVIVSIWMGLIVSIHEFLPLTLFAEVFLDTMKNILIELMGDILWMFLFQSNKIPMVLGYDCCFIRMV